MHVYCIVNVFVKFEREKFMEDNFVGEVNQCDRSIIEVNYSNIYIILFFMPNCIIMIILYLASLD